MDSVPSNAADGNARIYGLTDPRTHQLRYVGRTVHTLSKRLREHLHDAWGHRDKAPRFAWIRELLAANLAPEIFEIEVVPIAEMQDAEGFWISYFRFIGCALLNVPYRNGKEGARFRDLVWTPEMLAKLGKLPDQELGNQLGLPRRTVERKRHQLSIPKCGNRYYVIPPMGGWNKRELPQRIIDRLGTAPDHALAAECGVSKKVIQSARTARQIAAYAQTTQHPTRYHVGQPHPRWDVAGKRVILPDAIIARLGKESDRALARELRCHVSAIRRERIKRRIPDARSTIWKNWKA